MVLGTGYVCAWKMAEEDVTSMCSRTLVLFFQSEDPQLVLKDLGA